MNMRTYNAISYEEWYFTELAPALAVGRQDVVGHGLGCYVDGATEDTWAVTAESAEQRICMLMNQSALELDMFQINMNGVDVWPEPWWIAQLEKFLGGGFEVLYGNGHITVSRKR